jgi:hypothetical protein
MIADKAMKTAPLRMVVFFAILEILTTLVCAVGFICTDYHPPSNQEAYGSLAVAIVREDTIVVAADSRTVTDGVINPDTACKIIVDNNVVFAAAGLLKGNRNALGIVDYARSVLKSPTRTSYKIKTFQEGASRLLASWVDIPENREALTTSPEFRNKHSIHFMFCFFSDGKPVVVEFGIAPSIVGGRFKIGGVYDAGARKTGEILWIGAIEQICALMKTDTLFSERIRNVDAVSAAKILLLKQMEFTPGIVGGDVDLVLITSKGATWIQRKQNCE